MQNDAHIYLLLLFKIKSVNLGIQNFYRTTFMQRLFVNI